MIVRTLDSIEGTDRDVDAPTFHSRRFLLAGDGVHFSFHDTILYAGSVTNMWYKNHVEAVYCIEGTGRLTDHTNGQTYDIAPGTMYCLDGQEQHTLEAFTQLRMICVFDPALVGREVHDDEGAYPLLATPDTDGKEGDLTA